MSGPSQGSPVALALERPRLGSRALGDQARGLEQLVLVGVALGKDTLREAVRREDYVGVGASDPVGEDVDEGPVVVPALDHDELGPVADGLGDAVAVAADRDARVVRCEDEPDDPLCPFAERLVGGLCDARRPVLHADVDGRAQFVLERGALALGDLVQRGRAPDSTVALDELGHGFGAHRPPAADVLEVGRDVLGAGRAPVGHQDDGGFHFRLFPRAMGALRRGTLESGWWTGVAP